MPLELGVPTLEDSSDFPLSSVEVPDSVVAVFGELLIALSVDEPVDPVESEEGDEPVDADEPVEVP
ncbi:hypothetical protein A994_07866 [Methanobacterium formicicum DSM 3637]|uniref:Uncharacterized protein n=1 Tax=Methanobacterium formicicum (strain DSM 3637 / PP1) TaxID=1204725 RepID=K2R320_METFP|nr:hypothetical protein A994_07866 [Methanobacterium formicicum DSM 3637]